MTRAEQRLHKEIQKLTGQLQRAEERARTSPAKRVRQLEAAIERHRDGVLNHDRWDDEGLWRVLDRQPAQPVMSGGHSVSD